MPEFKDWTADALLRFLIFGRFKTGKTMGALTFPRVNVLDFDHGVGVAGNPEFIAKYGKKNFQYESFKELKVTAHGVPKDHNAFDDACRYFDACMSAGAVWTSPYTGKQMNVGKDSFDTWVVDSGTTLGEYAATKARVLLGGTSFGGKPLSQTQSQAMSTGLVVPKMQDFGAERSLVEQFVDMILSTDKHVILLCHEKEMLSDSGAVESVVPLFTGQSTERIPLKFDEVYQLNAKKSGTDMKRLLRTHTNGIVKCGTRTLGLPDDTPWDYDSIRQFMDKKSAPQSTIEAPRLKESA